MSSRTRKHRAQAGLEYLVIIALVLAILIPMAYYAYEEYRVQADYAQADLAVQKIADAIDLVYSQGTGSQTVVEVYVPQRVESISLAGREVLLKFRTSGGALTDVYRVTNANLTPAVLPDAENVQLLGFRYEADGNISTTVGGAAPTPTPTPLPDAPPAVTFSFPPAMAAGNIVFNATCLDDHAVSGLALWGNFTGAWEQNQTNASAVTNGANYDFAPVLLTARAYLWNARCCDNSSQCSYGGNQTLIVTGAFDSAPTVSLTSPADGNQSEPGTVNFTFVPADDYGFSSASVWTNYSGTWALSQANTSIVANATNNSILFSMTNAGTYAWNARACDNATQCAFAASNRTIRIRDVVPPMYFFNGSNATVTDTGEAVLHFAFWNNTVALSTYIFSYNYSGAYVNDTPVAFDASNWSNVTKAYSVEGTYGWRIFANDSSDNWNATAIAQITATAPDFNPTVSLSSPADGSTQPQGSISFQFVPTDDHGFRNASLWTNYTGTWALTQANTSAVTNATTNTIVFSLMTPGRYAWNVRACDNATIPQCAFATSNRSVRIVDTTPPAFFSNASNVTTAARKSAVLHYAFWNDSTALSTYIFSTNTSGAFVNDTPVAFTASNWSNVTRTYQQRGLWAWQVFANDSSNNFNRTGIRTVNITPLTEVISLNITNAIDNGTDATTQDTELVNSSDDSRASIAGITSSAFRALLVNFTADAGAIPAGSTINWVNTTTEHDGTSQVTNRNVSHWSGTAWDFDCNLPAATVDTNSTCVLVNTFTESSFNPLMYMVLFRATSGSRTADVDWVGVDVSITG